MKVTGDLWLQQLPIMVHVAGVNLILMDFHPHGAVKLDNEAVQMRLTTCILPAYKVGLLEDVLALAIEDRMSPLLSPHLLGPNIVEHDRMSKNLDIAAASNSQSSFMLPTWISC